MVTDDCKGVRVSKVWFVGETVAPPLSLHDVIA